MFISTKKSNLTYINDICSNRCYSSLVKGKKMEQTDPIVQIHRVKKPGQKKKMINAIAALVFFIILISISFIFLYPKNQKFILEDYQVNIITIDDLENRISLTGVIDLSNREAILAPYNSVCTSKIKKSGDNVIKGEVILILDSAKLLQDKEETVTELKKTDRLKIRNKMTYKRSRRASELSIKKSQRAIHRGDKKLDKMESLYKLGSATLQELEAVKDDQVELTENHYDIITGLANLEEDYISEEILLNYDLKTLNDQLSHYNKLIESLIIKAPFNGTILSVEPEIGEIVSQNEAIIKIGDLRTPYIILDVPEKNRQHLSLGQCLDIKIDKKVYTGKLSQINAVATISTNGGATILVEADFDTPPDNIIPGGQCGAEIIVNTISNCLTLPRGSFIVTGKDRYLYKVNANRTKAERIKIVYGNMNTSKVAIESGVEIGDEIITSSYTDFIDKEIIYLQKAK